MDQTQSNTTSYDHTPTGTSGAPSVSNPAASDPSVSNSNPSAPNLSAPNPSAPNPSVPNPSASNLQQHSSYGHDAGFPSYYAPQSEGGIGSNPNFSYSQFLNHTGEENQIPYDRIISYELVISYGAHLYEHDLSIRDAVSREVAKTLFHGQQPASSGMPPGGPQSQHSQGNPAGFQYRSTHM
ncbi:uncharacterized protein N7446_010707 [Penicillium canescens]|uniref:Uncharacterized protein n=1 Tax=Penicillium canescens TaxID=5083 RepID=A0AAD6IBA0_PENCN|nr:uncharacterized protein N7446_010707 [Penicillium canescens]KAJ6041404.1 hypothetical protein N7460_006794 [Penicillium canescens]KAJ6050598.1 hypothetical protein N7446_010707 [Penicillium canescens]KAJ6065817.1 hypothetical protein N7444_001470 [Penicillium canescens]